MDTIIKKTTILSAFLLIGQLLTTSLAAVYNDEAWLVYDEYDYSNPEDAYFGHKNEIKYTGFTPRVLYTNDYQPTVSQCNLDWFDPTRDVFSSFYRNLDFTAGTYRMSLTILNPISDHYWRYILFSYNTSSYYCKDLAMFIGDNESEVNNYGTYTSDEFQVSAGQDSAGLRHRRLAYLSALSLQKYCKDEVVYNETKHQLEVKTNEASADLVLYQWYDALTDKPLMGETSNILKLDEDNVCGSYYVLCRHKYTGDDIKASITLDEDCPLTIKNVDADCLFRSEGQWWNGISSKLTIGSFYVDWNTSKLSSSTTVTVPDGFLVSDDRNDYQYYAKKSITISRPTTLYFWLDDVSPSTYSGQITAVNGEESVSFLIEGVMYGVPEVKVTCSEDGSKLLYVEDQGSCFDYKWYSYDGRRYFEINNNSNTLSIEESDDNKYRVEIYYGSSRVFTSDYSGAYDYEEVSIELENEYITDAEGADLTRLTATVSNGGAPYSYIWYRNDGEFSLKDKLNLNNIESYISSLTLVKEEVKSTSLTSTYDAPYSDNKEYIVFVVDACGKEDVKFFTNRNVLLWLGNYSENVTDVKNWAYANGDGSFYSTPIDGISDNMRYDIYVGLYDENGNKRNYLPNLTQRQSLSCRTVHFLPGGQIGGIENLDYENAYATITLDGYEKINPSDQKWYLMSMPIKSVVSGDLRHDSVLAYIRYYTLKNDANKWEASWSRSMPETDIDLNSYRNGFAYRFKSVFPSVSVKKDISFTFPSSSNAAKSLASDDILEAGKMVVDLSTAYIEDTFLFDAQNFEPENVPVLVANPFMSALDLETLYNRNKVNRWNSQGILNSFYLFDGSSIVNYVSGKGNDSYRYVAPFQSFFVIPYNPSNIKNATYTLNISNEMSTVSTSRTLRSASSIPNQLNITAEMDSLSSSAIVSADCQSSNSVVRNEDFIQLLLDECYIQIYSLHDQTAYYLNQFNVDSLGGLVVPIGVKLKTAGDFDLSFSGVDNFESVSDILWIDLLEDDTISLKETNRFTVSVDTLIGKTAVFNNRFELMFVQNDRVVEEIYDTICAGEIYNKYGFTIQTVIPDEEQFTVFEKDTLLSVEKDSITRLYLNVLQVKDTLITDTVCVGDGYEDNGFSISETDTAGVYQYQQVYSSADLCDSTVTLNLRVSPIVEKNISVDLCEGGSYYIPSLDSSIVMDEVGEIVFPVNLSTIYGCDSIIRYNFNVHKRYFGTDSVSFTIEELEQQGLSAVDSTYLRFYRTVEGCDSLILTTVKVLQEETGKEETLFDGVQIYIDNNVLAIVSQSEEIQSVIVSDLLGKKIVSDFEADYEKRYPVIEVDRAYLVSVTSRSGKMMKRLVVAGH